MVERYRGIRKTRRSIACPTALDPQWNDYYVIPEHQPCGQRSQTLAERWTLAQGSQARLRSLSCSTGEFTGKPIE